MDNKETNRLKRRRRALHKKMVKLGPLMRGSVVELSTTCGNLNCRCARGEKHKKLYYSLSTKGKTKLVYLGKQREELARQYCAKHRELLDIIEEMTKINVELLKAKTPSKTR